MSNHFKVLANLRSEMLGDLSKTELDALNAAIEALARQGELDRLIAALRVIQQHHNLGDTIYSVRERIYGRDPEFKGVRRYSWEHPTIVEYSAAVSVVEKALAASPIPPVGEKP